MWRYLIVTLLVFNSGYGRTFQSLKTNPEDVYEVIEDKAANTVSFVNPQSVMPILREITYYHVVEKPYDTVVEQNKEVVDNSSEDKTERPFTNAHGLEFIDTYGVNDTVPKTEKNNDEDLIDYLLLEDNNEETAEGSNFEDDKSRETVEDQKETTLVPEEEAKIEVVTKAELESSSSNVLPKEEPAVDNQQRMNETATSEYEQTTTLRNIHEVQGDITAHTETTSRKERNRQLFGSPQMLKERYKKMKNLIPSIKPKEPVIGNASEQVETVKSRRRRSTIEEKIAKIPEAPKLAELNFNSLPEYIKRLYASKNPFTKPTPIKVTTEKSKSKEVEKYKQELEHKLEDIFSTLKPDHSTLQGTQEIDINADGIVNIATDEVRTYGMNLTSDGGHVWNNLWSNPGMNYHVGELETVDEDKDKEQIAVSQLQHSKPEAINFNPDEKPSTEEEELKPNKEETEDEPKPNKETEDLLEDLNDIQVNVDKKKPEPYVMHPIVEESTPVEEAENPAKHEVTEIQEDKEKDEEKDPETLKDLLNDKKFWDWLSDWTSTYMDLLIKHISIIVKEEISKQMESNKSNPIKKQDEQDINKTNAEFEKHEETNKKGDDDNEKNLTADKKSHTSILSDNKEDEGIENEKHIFVDGKKIPLTTTSNFNQTNEHLSKKRRKEEQKDVKDNETKVVAQNIYGNSVGSSKVVNHYFFFTEDKKNVIDELIKPLLNENGNIHNVTFQNRLNVPDEDKKVEKESKKEDSKKVETKEEDSKKVASQKEDTKKENTKIEDSEKEETKKQDSKKEDSKKEDSKNEVSKKEEGKEKDSTDAESKKQDNQTATEKVIENKTATNQEPTTENPQADSKEHKNNLTTVTSAVTETSTTTKSMTKEDKSVQNTDKNDKEKSSEKKESSSIKESNKDDEKNIKDSKIIDTEKKDTSNVEETEPKGDSEIKEPKSDSDIMDIKIQADKLAYQSLFSKPSTKEKMKTKNTKSQK